MPPDSSAQVLLVEGQDDKHVVKQICWATESKLGFSILKKEGFDNLRSAISLDIKAPGRKTVGILVDANDDPKARWQAIADRLKKADISPPASPCPNGTIVRGNLDLGRPRVGIWLMPDNVSPGELEDFIAGMIPRHDAVWPLSRKYIADIPAPLFSERKTRKAEVHAWLATRQKPRRGMGQAIRARDLDVASDVCRRFVTWLRQLFG